MLQKQKMGIKPIKNIFVPLQKYRRNYTNKFNQLKHLLQQPSLMLFMMELNYMKNPSRDVLIFFLVNN